MGFFSSNKKKEDKVDTTYCEILKCKTREELQKSITNIIKSGKVIKDIKLIMTQTDYTALLIYDPWEQKKEQAKNNSLER